MTPQTPADLIPHVRDHYRRILQRGRNGEVAAVMVLLLSPRLPSPARFGRYITSATSATIDWDGVLAEEWSGTERFLLATAASLWWSRRVDIDLSRLAYLDDGQYRLWLDMIEASRTSCLPG